MSRTIHFEVCKDGAGKRLDLFLTEKLPEFSRSSVQKLIKNGSVQYCGEDCTVPKTPLRKETLIAISLPEKREDTLPFPENIPLDIIYEDEDIMVLNKPPGIVVHPGDGTPDGTIVNALLFRFAKSADGETGFAERFNDKSRPGIVHRLDKDTSGCLLVAKNQNVLDKLADSFKKHEVEKSYIAIVHGTLHNKTAVIRNRIGRHPVNRKKMAVLEEGGKEAVTHYEVLGKLEIDKQPCSCLKVRIETGRTHQIRVHMAAIHHPVVGDELYGPRRKINAVSRQMLHAWKLQISHPVTSEILDFTAPLMEDMQNLIDASNLNIL